MLDQFLSSVVSACLCVESSALSCVLVARVCLSGEAQGCSSLGTEGADAGRSLVPSLSQYSIMTRRAADAPQTLPSRRRERHCTSVHCHPRPCLSRRCLLDTTTLHHKRRTPLRAPLTSRARGGATTLYVVRVRRRCGCFDDVSFTRALESWRGRAARVWMFLVCIALRSRRDDYGGRVCDHFVKTRSCPVCRESERCPRRFDAALSRPCFCCSLAQTNAPPCDASVASLHSAPVEHAHSPPVRAWTRVECSDVLMCALGRFRSCHFVANRRATGHASRDTCGSIFPVFRALFLFFSFFRGFHLADRPWSELT